MWKGQDTQGAKEPQSADHWAKITEAPQLKPRSLGKDITKEKGSPTGVRSPTPAPEADPPLAEGPHADGHGHLAALHLQGAPRGAGLLPGRERVLLTPLPLIWEEGAFWILLALGAGRPAFQGGQRRAPRTRRVLCGPSHGRPPS